MPLVHGHRYLPSTAVFLCEILKLTICSTLALYDMSRTMSPSIPATSLFSGLTIAVFTGDSWKLAIPASLYVLQNSLQYFAISNLDTAVFQVTYQFKILPTAIFSVILLGRTLSLRKWLALALLMFGVAIVQLPAADTASLAPLKDPHTGYRFPWALGGFRGIGTSASAPLYKRSATYEGIQQDDELEHPKMSTSLGVGAALMGCTVSSLASVYFEKILKDTIHPVSLWVRNVQLAFYSMFPALFIGVFYVDGERIARNGFFAGYNWTVWSTLLLQAIGGMVVSLCVNYADNIAKTFAMSISILISLCASVWLFEFTMTRNFIVGTTIVLFSTYLYSLHDRGPRPAALRIHELEKTTIDSKPLKSRSIPMKHPATPLKSEGKSSSRPSSPGRHHSRYLVYAHYLSEVAPSRNERHHHTKYPANLVSVLRSYNQPSFNFSALRENVEDFKLPKMSGPSCNIDKLLREIQGASQPHISVGQSNPVSRLDHQTTTSMSNHYPTYHSANPRQQPRSRDSFDVYQVDPHALNVDDYERPLDAFDQALLDEPEATYRVDGSNQREQAPIREGQQHPITATQYSLSPRQSFRTPPSKLLAQPSSPAYPPPSSPLASIIQGRGIQPLGSSERLPFDNQRTSLHPPYRNVKARGQAMSTSLNHALPTVQGIQLVSPNELPDRFRAVFPFPLFNAVQSKCYVTAYKTSDNLVLSAPTGSGKTAILELSICQLISGFQMDQFKIVYMAPTKSLCTERQKDWQAKFAALDLQCAELTGDTDQGQLRNIQKASIIVTTPEKWDSMTRKWRDHAKLMQLVKLFLIDEVHILKESRGACLEAVVSRTKSVGSNVRFIALSATVPNSEDIAVWLGQNSATQHLPAHREIFGEEFRPVKLQKHVYGLQFNGNDWGFDKFSDPKLPEIISKHSQKKPIMVFCITRKSTVSTAKLLAEWWSTKSPRERQWAGPTFRLTVQDSDLKETLPAGVAFHHAGLDALDRNAIEKGFLEGQVNVICCTSTLAVGVNLPCHMVIIKNTMSFQDEGLKEYSDLEIMQMLGRAGRPQFEDSAVAVIITKQEKVQKYEKMVSGQELLESSLHLNLIEHLNAEIGLGTIHNLHTAKRWLAGTFLYVRLGHNPLHYGLDGDDTNMNLDNRIERICRRDIDLLVDAQLVTNSGDKLMCSEFGNAMARYYVKFETMKGLLSLEPRSKMSDVLSVLVGAEEFHEVRFRVSEKRLLKDINGGNGVKYPIKVDIALPQHKRSLIIQFELGGVDFPADEQFARFQRQFSLEKNIIFKHIHRLVRCVIDCQIHLEDAVTVRHALELARSFAARVWDNSPYQMKQVPNIGPAAVRRLANGGINSIESLEAAEPHKIEMLMSKHPPFGSRILSSLKDYPKLRVSIKMTGKVCEHYNFRRQSKPNETLQQDVKRGQPVKIKVKAEVGFMNEKAPTYFHRKAVYVCFLAERSDGRLVDFRRISATKLQNGQDILISVELLQQAQYVTCYVMCDEIAGTMRYAELKPNLPSSVFPSPPLPDNQDERIIPVVPCNKKSSVASSSTVQGDEGLYDDGAADADLLEAATLLGFNDIEAFETSDDPNSSKKKAQGKTGKDHNETNEQDWAPTQLQNGKWACNHKCKDKTACKHLCCHEGIDKPPKAPKQNANDSRPKSDATSAPKQSSVQMKLPMEKPIPRQATKDIETVDLAQRRTSNEYAKVAPRAYRALHHLHEKVNQNHQIPVITSAKPSFSYKKGDQPTFTFLAPTDRSTEEPSSDYGSGWMDELPSPSALLQGKDQTDISCQATQAVHELLSSQALDAGAEDFELDRPEDPEKLPIISPSAVEPMKSTIFADDEYDEAMGNLGSDGLSQYFADSAPIHIAKNTSEQKLFMSIDSPEKLSSPPHKRKCIEESGNDRDDVNSIHEAKRQQFDTVTNPPVPQRSPDPEIVDPAPTVPPIKPGYPDWVYEFDPAFVAEWEPYRKTEGLKLGQTIAKDLTKRIPPGTASKSALRDPIVELDVTGKCVGADGFRGLAGALIKSLEHEGELGKVCQLEELSLKSNKLDATCLPALSRIVRLAAHDLRDLDLSDNCFSITNSRDADVWQDFLQSFAECCVLRRLDLSENALGPKAFETLARVYSRELVIGDVWEGSADTPPYDATPGRRSISGYAASLERQARKLSLGSASGELSDDDEHASTASYPSEQGIRRDSKSPGEIGHGNLPDLFHIYSTTRGLRSVPYLILPNTGMTDTGALHLSYIICSHHHPGRLLRNVPPPKSSHHIQQLDFYDNKTKCQGIVYLPNDGLSNPAYKLLELCEVARASLFDHDRRTQTSRISPTHSIKIPATRKTSISHTSPSTTATGARRRSGTTGEHNEQNDGEAVIAELDRARSRIQGNVLKEMGVHSNDLWRTALRMLVLCRILCPLQKELPQTTPPVERHNRPIKVPENPDFPTLPKTNSRPFVGYLNPFAPPPAAKYPNMPATPISKNQPPRLKTATPSPLSLTTSPTSPKAGQSTRPYVSDLPHGLAEDTWAYIVSLHLGADRFMSENQQRNVLRWAVDRKALAKELESLGKPESAQIWKVLDGMGCLAYESDRV
ncbi:MAG: hypothetical protein Q9170_006107 [Blastenia crenularia]